MNIRNLFLLLYSRLGVDQLFLNDNPRVLFYHGVAQKVNDERIETESISAADFERQLKYITRHFNPISADEFCDRFANQTWHGSEILMTFDDGYKNMLSTGLPLLEKYKVPFALFLTTDIIANDELFPTTINRLVNLASSYGKTLGNAKIIADETSRLLKTEPIAEVDRMCAELLSKISGEEFQTLRAKYSSINPMNWDEALEISKSPLCTIGSHCATHICCHAKQAANEVRRQFLQSKNEIESHLGIQCKYLSYPNGNYTPQVMAIAKECGYDMAFTTKYRTIIGPETNAMAIGRIYVPYDYNRFKYAISRFPGR